jgi:uncharacterized repeat protein (TIGR03837 family)
MLWDLFCRVIDNHGDVGVCWRLAADLASRGEPVRLWIDDASALDWMAPLGSAGVAVHPWPMDAHDFAAVTPGEVVIEAFGCELPAGFVATMARQPRPPVWINLEYLSAERYVEASHGLRSPQLHGPGAGLDKWFFYPGFSARTGGLLREANLIDRQAGFSAVRWLAERGWSARGGEQVVALFSYNNPALPRLIADLARQPTLLLACPGPSQDQLAKLELPATVRRINLPWLSQPDFDRLLWSAELNCVRGEDSFVRAAWAGKPFLWQIYPQGDNAHAAKLDAFMQRFTASAAREHADKLSTLARAWNGLAPWPERWPASGEWAQTAQLWRTEMLRLPDLVTQLLSFVAERR